MKNYTYSLLIISFIVLLIACAKHEELPGGLALDLPEEAFDYESTQEVPSELFFFNDNTPIDNQLTNEGATLGRVLFYDKRLSISNKTSCASCHVQELGFADNQRQSEGFFLESTRRNAPGLANMRHQPDFFWDAREHSLEEQVTQPIMDHIEMGFDDERQMLERMELLTYYPPLFEAAYGSEEITQEKVAKSLAQFVRSMTSYNTKFDQGRQNDFATFTETETRGMELFSEALPCAGCHGGPDLGGWDWGNIGLSLNYEDEGIAELSAFEGNVGVFSVPTLRNITHTAPYMHDGSFNTLTEVIRHYAQEVEPHPQLSFNLVGGGWFGTSGDIPVTSSLGEPLRFDISDDQIQDIIAFLGTLTDHELMTDERFSDPFIELD